MFDANDLDQVIARLEDVEKHSGYLKAACPAHDDRNPSLSVTQKGQKVFFKCHAGCNFEEIISALGERENGWREHRPQTPKTKTRGKIEATYDYGDFQVVRFEGKQFRQRRKVGGGWVYNLDGVTPCLYHEDEVREAAARGGTLYVVEGEKDVERLRALDLTATCNPMGAGKWRDEYADALRGADVIVVADRDTPGRKHALNVKQSLTGTARSVRVVEALTGKDASDHLDAGHSVEQFVPADRFSPIDLGKLITDGIEPPEFLIEDVLYRAKAHALMGEPGDGKTLAMLAFAARLIAEGKRVVWLDEENGPQVVASRLEKLGANPSHVSERFVYFAFSEPTLDDAAELIAQIVALTPDLVVFDSGADMYVAADLDENSNRDMTEWATTFTQRLARLHGIASVILEHVAKGSDGSYQRGAGAKKAKVDAAWRLEVRSPFDAETVGEIDLVRAKDRLAHLPERVRYEIGGREGKVVFSRVEVEDEQQRIVAARAQKEDFFRSALLKALRDHDATDETRGIPKRRLIELMPPGIDTKALLALIQHLVHDPTTPVRQSIGARNAHLIYLEEEASQ